MKSTSSDDEAAKPNLFLFLADYLSETDLGFNGNPFVKNRKYRCFCQISDFV
jgi:hypothetical protein